MNRDDVRERICDVLETHSTMTLATAGSDGPWAATVFFASDEHLNVYFVSDQRTRHGRDLMASATVAGAIHRDISTWDDVLGLQVEGQAAVLTGAERAAALELYLRRFTDVRRLFEAPRDDSERLIADRLRSTAFWRLTPRWVRLVDNSRGFGWKQELVLGA